MSGVERSGYSPARLVLVAAGVLALALALTAGTAVAPVTAAVEFLIERAGNDYAVAAALGIVAVAVAAMVLLSGREATMRQTEMPTVERPVPAKSAGEPFDEATSSWRFGTPVLGRSARADARDRLRRAAIGVVADDDGPARREARRRVEEGVWTDDPVAAAYLAGERASIGVWIAALGRGETAGEYRARRAVAAVVDRHGRSGRGSRADGGTGTDA